MSRPSSGPPTTPVFKPTVGSSTAQRVHQAVALAYEAHSVAPRVVAKGEGLVAEAILSRARELGVPLKAEPEMVALLMQLELESFIPPALYLAVAEVLVWAYQSDERLRPSSPLHSSPGSESV